MPLSLTSLSPRGQYILLSLMQVALLPALWGHTSDSTAFLGRYSSRYGAVLVIHAITLIVLALAAWQADRVNRLVQRIPMPIRFGGVAIAALLSMVVWWPSLELQVRAFFALLFTQIACILILSLPDRSVSRRPFFMAVGVMIVVLIIPLAITVHSALPYSPDEAHWADMSSAFVRYGGVYTPSWQRTPILLEPGIGWSVAAYGMLVHAADYTVWTGRLWTAAVHLLTIACMGLVARRWWGGAAAGVTMLVSALSFSLFPILDYRPDYQLPLGQMLALLCAIQARQVARWKNGWHLLCGLLAVLTMEMHAAGIIVAFGFGILYLVEALWSLWSQESWRSTLSKLIWFGVGGVLGVAIYYLANIASIGGLNVYLGQLVSERGAGIRPIKAFIWPSAYEAGLIVAALAYYGWQARCTRTFPMLLVLIVGTIIGALLFDTQGYFSVYKALYLLPVGALLVGAFRAEDVPLGTNTRAVWIAACVVLCLVGQITGGFIAWNRVGDVLESRSLPPYPVEALGDQIRAEMPADARIATTHEFIWSFADWPAFYSIGAEITQMRQQDLQTPLDAWDRLEPDTIVYLVNTMEMTPGLKQYIERDQFQLCKTYTYGELRAELYRRTCF